MFGGCVFQQTVDLWVQTVLLFSSTFFFIPLFILSRRHSWASQEKREKIARSFNFTFHYSCIDGVLSLNNFIFVDYDFRIYRIELEINIDLISPFIIFTQVTEYLSTRGWYLQKDLLTDKMRRFFDSKSLIGYIQNTVTL